MRRCRRITATAVFFLLAICFPNGSGAEEQYIKPPQGLAPVFYLYHPGYYHHEGMGALGNWLWVSWNKIEVRKDVYDWSIIDSYLEREGGKTTRLKNGQIIRKPIALSLMLLPDVRYNEIPDYIYQEITGSSDRNVWISKYPAYPKLGGKICTAETCNGCACDCGPVLRPPWEHWYFQERYRKIVKLLGARYNNDPRVSSVWIAPALYGENVTTGLGGCIKGDEPGGCAHYNNCRFDFSSTLLGNWMIQKDILGLYREAFPTKPLFIINSAPTGRKELTVRALQLSPPVGIKHHALEFDLPDQNSSDNDQWRTINYYWSEVEAKGLEGMAGFEHFFYPAPPHTYWALLAGLSRRATIIDLAAAHLDVIAQMQLDYERAQLARDNSADYFPLWAFMEDHFARSASNTPSVWIVLRDTAYTTGEPGDWEFYLYRAENIGGQQIPVDRAQAKTKSVSVSTLPQAARSQFIGSRVGAFVRRTDQATQNYYMYFKVDERWPASGTRGFQIEITYVDIGSDTFSIQYGPGMKKELVVQKRNTGKFVRETFDLPDFSPLEKINAEGDHFRLDCKSNGDEYIHMIRLIPKNWQAPKWAFEGSDRQPPAPPTGLVIE